LVRVKVTPNPNPNFTVSAMLRVTSDFRTADEKDGRGAGAAAVSWGDAGEMQGRCRGKRQEQSPRDGWG